LDEKFELALDDNQNVFTVFESLEDARFFAEKVLASNSDIEIVIYSHQKDVLYFSNPIN
jgi:hypothetical protein